MEKKHQTRRSEGKARWITVPMSAPLLASSMMLLVLLVLCAPALAVGLEKPEALAPSEVKAETATLQGTLSPKSPGEVGSTYEFVYKASKTGECKGGSATTPVESIMGLEAEPVSEPVGALKPDTEYAVCLVVHNAAKTEVATSIAVPFKTYLTPETPETKPADPIAGTTATLRGVLNPDKKGEAGSKYEFRYRLSAVECQGENELSTGEQTETGATPEPVSAEVTDLLPATTYTFCLRAFNEAGEEALGSPETFKTPVTAPTVTGGEASEVGSTTATVSAGIDPDGLSTSYHTEYVTDAQFEAGEWAEAERVPAPDAELPAANTAIPVSESLAGLAPATGYHFRFAATNSASSPATVFSSPAVFTTATSSIAAAGALPDNRAYELVSTSGSAGELYMPPAPYGEPDTGIIATHLLFHVAPNGERVTYIGGPSFSATSGNGSVNSGNGNQWLATRTARGWATEDISVPGTGPGAFYQGFSSDLATAVLLGERQPLALGVTTGCTALYARSSEAGNLTPLLTDGMTSAQECGTPQFAGASEDGSQIIFESTANLAPPAREGATQNLFESTGGHLDVVNVLASGEVPNASFAKENAISRDGTRVFWVDTEDDHLFVLESGSTNVQVSRNGSASFLALPPGGRYAYYEEEGALWRFNTLTNTSEQLEAATAGVKGVVGASEDGSYLYFIAEKALAPGAQAETCVTTNPDASEVEEEQRGTGCNLYVIHEGLISFIANLSPQDGELQPESSNYLGSDWSSSPKFRTAEVTPNGTSVVFESHRGLAGYGVKRRVRHYEPEVFVYSAASGQVACASCTASGGGSEASAVNELTVGGDIAREVPTWISSDGSRVFFESVLPLVAADTNGVEDVYEWEREGAGGCSIQVPARPSAGCVYLLSDGESSVPSFLVSADGSGDNVFFTHDGPLGHVPAPEGQNELYDARVNGGFTESALACTGTGCQGVPPAAPSIGTPPSVTFTGGSSNFAPVPPAKKVTKRVVKCKKGRALRKGKCVKRKAPGRTKAKKTNTQRRTHR